MDSRQTAELNRSLDQIKAKVFLGSNAAFLGPLMASLNFMWQPGLGTSATDYKTIFWDPDDFNKCTVEERVSTVIHELAHNYRLHGMRQGARCPDVWNVACDIVIARESLKSGYVLGANWIGPHPEIPHEVEEDIYDYLKKNQIQLPMASCCSQHGMGSIPKQNQQAAVQNVVRAMQQAKMGGKPGDIPGNLEQILDKFLRPKIRWEQHLYQWFVDFLNSKYNYSPPNRRYRPHGILIKSRSKDMGRLDHLVYYFDVSGSCTDNMVTRFNSEVKYIKDTFQPRKLELVLFDTKIQRVFTFTEDEDFNELRVTGRGGTSLTEVRQHMMASKATAAIVFTDLECTPMQTGPTIPIIWICVNNPSATVPFGKLLHLEEDYY